MTSFPQNCYPVVYIVRRGLKFETTTILLDHELLLLGRARTGPAAQALQQVVCDEINCSAQGFALATSACVLVKPRSSQSA